MDATIKYENLKKSVTKHFVDNIETISGIAITFDDWLDENKAEFTTAKQWVSINLSNVHLERLSTADLTIILRTQEDPEGFKISRLHDTIMNSIVSDVSDNFYITLFDTSTDPWRVIGGIYVKRMPSGQQEPAPDKSKLMVLNYQLKWGAKL